jgi:TatD DNase family protein
MEMQYFDAHCHVQFDQYDADREAVLASMEEAGVGGIVVGVDGASSRKAAELVQDHEHLYASVGLHPNDTPEEVFDEHLFRNLLMYPKVVAVGECGLDYFRLTASDRALVLSEAEAKAKQKEVFAKHVKLAATVERPLMIHARPSKGTMDAYHDLIDMLEAAKQEHGERLTGNVHFFVGGAEEAKRLWALGFTTSYTAVITFARDYDEAIRQAPLTQLLSETDAPYIAPLSRRGQRNDSLAIPEVVARIAEIRAESVETVRAALLENARRMFRLD